MNTNEDYVILEQIGKGSYGKIHRCTNSKGDIYAVKKMECNNYGITSLLELSIMSTYRHSNISYAEHIKVVENSIYIFQQIAEMDMSEYIRDNNPNNAITKLWSYQLLSAVYYLHKHRIIHCDIKPNNVLIYDDNNIKLIDFTFSLMKINEDDTYGHNVGCTIYSAPEVLAGNLWSTQIDIWSLGCTLYELATGENLVPEQINCDKKCSIRTKKLIKDLTLSSITEWRSSIGDDDAKEVIPVLKHKCSILMSENWNDVDKEMQDIILEMTAYDPDKRPTAELLLGYDYFSDMNKELITYSTTPGIVPKLDRFYANKINEFFYGIRYSYTDIINLTHELYSRTNSDFTHSLLRIETCFLIAHKLIKNKHPKYKLYSSRDDINKLEAKICANLSYRLHETTPEGKKSYKLRSYRKFYTS